MKKTLSILSSLLMFMLGSVSLSNAQEEDARYPMLAQCSKVSEHAQETRWCKTFDKALINSDWLRNVDPRDKSYLLTVVVVEFCERTQTLGVSTTVLFVSPWFAGQYPWLMSNLKVLEPGPWKSIAEELVADMEGGFKLSSQGLADAIIELNQGRESYKSVGDEYERYFENSPFDLDRLDLRPQLCRGTDVMLNLSRAR
jgi:hypothetical protein